MRLTRAMAVAVIASFALFQSVGISVSARSHMPKGNFWKLVTHHRQLARPYFDQHLDRHGRVRPDLELRAIRATRRMHVVTALRYGAAGTSSKLSYKKGRVSTRIRPATV